MPFEYPKPLVVGNRTWIRADSYVNPSTGDQVLYKAQPVRSFYAGYDHISIVVGQDRRPLNNEIHVTLRCTAPFQRGGSNTVAINSNQVTKSWLVFYWDYVVDYNGGVPTLAAGTNQNAGRPIKALANDQALVSHLVINQAVNSRQDLVALRANTELAKSPAAFVSEFWADLLRAQPVTVQVSSNDDRDSLMLDYQIVLPAPHPAISGTLGKEGKLTITNAIFSEPSRCGIRFPSHCPQETPLNKKNTTFMLPSGRYMYTIKS